mgnify:CR=1 FL=1
MNNTGIFENGIEPKEFWFRLSNHLCSHEEFDKIYFFHEDNDKRILLLGKSSDSEVLDLPEDIRRKISNSHKNDIADLQESSWRIKRLHLDGALKIIVVIKFEGPQNHASWPLLELLINASFLAYNSSRDLGLKSENLSYVTNVLDLGLIVGDSQIFDEAAMKICNQVASQFDAMRVSIGWNDMGGVKVRATNHGGNIRRDTERVGSLSRVMEEALVQESEIFFPNTDSELVNQQHKSYSQSGGKCALISMPIKEADSVIGVITVEYDPENNTFCDSHLSLLRVFMDLISPRLSLLHSSTGWLGKRLWRRFRKRVESFLGYRHTGLKVTCLFIIMCFILSFIIRVDHNVKAPFVLRSEATVVLTSPVAGYIEGVHFKVGDIVKKGDLLVSLDQREILMKRAQSIADRASQTNDVRRYEAEGKLTDMRLAQLSVKKAEAQIKLLDYQLDKALIESPFDGVVVEGDLSDRLSSPVKPGEPLIRVTQLTDTYGELQVDERDVHFIKNGLSGKLAYTSNPKNFYDVRIDKYEPVAVIQEQGTFFRVRASITNATETWWKPGMSGICKVYIGKRSVAWVFLHRTVEFIKMKLWI